MLNCQSLHSISKSLCTLGIVVFVQFMSTGAFCQTPATTYYVATDGNDNSAGSLSAPFQTIERARSAAMQVKGNANVTIYLRGGEYYFPKLFSLSDKNWDSTKSLLISSYQGEAVSFSGGVKLDNSRIGTVQDAAILQRLKPGARNNVFVTSLRDQGITDAGVMRSAGYGHPKLSSQSELFIDGKPSVLARAPNSGKLPIGAVDSKGGILRSADTSSKAQFHFNYPATSQWQNVASGNIWVSGFFNMGWADETIPVASIGDNTVQLAAPTTYGVYSSVKSPNNVDRDRLVIRGFYFFNVLEELDTTGEYFVDQDHSLLYFWLDGKPAGQDIHLSVLKDPIVVITNLSNITFQGITFEYSRGAAVQIKHSAKIVFRHDNFSALGMDGITTNNCTGCVITNCKFFDLGASGVILDGGDRKDLVPSNNLVQQSEFFHTGRVFRSFNPAINISGVGSTVTNCYIHDLAGQAISYQGNNHLITNNYIKDVCKEFSDVGAVATGRDPSSAGTLIANNFFENVTCPPDLIVTAIYIDDGSGGIKVHNNVFLHCGTGGSENSNFGFGAIHINGGSDNEFLNNIFINDRIGFSGGLWNDQRWNEYLNSDFIKKMTTKDVNIFSDTYVKNYPFLKNFFDPGRTRNNTINNSLAYNTKQFSLPKNNVVSNLFAEDNMALGAKKTYADVAAFFKTYPYPAIVKAWPNWSPVNFALIGMQP